MRIRYFLAGLLTGALILVTQTSYGHRLSGNPRSLKGRLGLAKRQVIHDQQEISSRHGWRLLSLAALSHGWWLSRDVAYQKLLQRLIQPSIPWPWSCIHRYEGSWTDPNPPYFGGLQLDLGFQRTYGGEYLARYGTADHWPPVVQVRVAMRARDGYHGFRGRGYSPWPNTARACGLL